MNRKKLIISLSIVLFSVIVIFSSLFIVFKQSVKYAAYQLFLAKKYQDSQLALQYFDLEKMTDAEIVQKTDELINSGNPFATIGINMLNNMRDTLISKNRQSVIEVYEEENPELKKINDIKILYCIITEKPILNTRIVFKKVSKNKVIQNYIHKDGSSSPGWIWIKENKRWRTIGA